MVKRRRFTEEFKKDAVRLLRNRGTRTIADVAQGLGVSPNMLARWQNQYSTEVAGGPGRAEEARDDVEKLRRRVRELEMENALLKKAAALVCHEQA